jgi:hypothetical protein
MRVRRQAVAYAQRVVSGGGGHDDGDDAVLRIACVAPLLARLHVCAASLSPAVAIRRTTYTRSQIVVVRRLSLALSLYLNATPVASLTEQSCVGTRIWSALIVHREF